jgi:type II secretory pathway component PulF
MAGMNTPDKTELMAALTDNGMQIQQAVSQLTNRLNNKNWHEALDAIAELRRIEADLESKIKALAENGESGGALP